MRYMKFLAAFVALVVATACVHSDIDDVTIKAPSSNGDIQVVGRITQYSDCDVATRSKKDGDEPKITSMGLALFPITEGTIGDCVYYDYKEGGSIVFIIEREKDIFDIYENTQFAMYIFANMQGSEKFPTKGESNREVSSGIEGVGKSLDYFTSCTIDTSADVETIPSNGFPMMGSLGNNVDTVDGDGVYFILKPTPNADNVDGLPIVGEDPTDNLEIPLKSMYAKVSFTISVKPDQEIVGNRAPRFDLLKYTVHNIAKSVDSKTNQDTEYDVVDSSNEYTFSGKYAQGATVATFDFYIPERYLTPVTSAENFEYPFGGLDENGDIQTVTGYSNLRKEDQKYAQRFKPLLPDSEQNATYVTFEGKYLDHQGYSYNVSYNIFLGSDNYSNFDIIRNTHYNNNITIRGISASNDQATNTDGIAIDWRVEVERSTPLVINLRRESLLDAHYEVRPLRLRLVGENIPTGTSATVSILNEDGKTTSAVPAWIRLEASGNTSAHITTGVSAGKRKYFTTDLVTNTLKDNTSIGVNNLTTDNQTLWIYVDENIDTKPRAAVVRITYQGEVKDYKIVQNGLYAVQTTRNASIDGVSGEYTYYIEQYEEYLYNYDAEDLYGQTELNGMEWGLNAKQLSYNDAAIYLTVDPTGWYSSFLQYFGFGNFTEMANQALIDNKVDPKYDFYTWRDVMGLLEKIRSNLEVHNFDGHSMNKNMIGKYPSYFPSRTLESPPKSAIEYCYNRNKRESDGSIKPENILWYLPAIDEIEDIVEYAHASFQEFQGNMYWSCQPAYERHEALFEFWEAQSIFGGFDQKDDIEGMYYIDDVYRARATRALRENGSFAGVPNSGADIKGTQNGVLRIRSSLVAASKEYTHGNYEANQSFDATYKNYPGNLPRTGTKARVRCVRKMN